MDDIGHDTPCRACGEHQTKPIAISNFFLPEKDPTLWVDGFCETCGTITHFPKPSTSVITYHDSAYRDSGNIVSPPVSLPWSTVTFERFSHVNELLTPYINQLPEAKSKALRHLDFGGYNGFMSYGLGQLQNLESTIADLDPRGLAMARALDLSTIDLSRSGLPVNTFDLITAIQVVEHLENPHDELNSIFSSMRSTGALLYCEVPNILSFPTRDPAHFTTFSPGGFYKLLLRSGFKVLELGYCSTPPVAAAFTWPYFSRTESVYLLATNDGHAFGREPLATRQSINLFLAEADHLDYSTFQRRLHLSGARLGLRNAVFYAIRGGRAVIVNVLKAHIALLFLITPSVRLRNRMTMFLSRSRRLAAMRSS